jgi:hypothetical protein
MSKFAIPQRFESTIADEGQWFEVVDEHNNTWGEFQCRLMDQDSRTYKLAQERVHTRMQKLHRNKPVDNEVLLREIFLDAVLVNWRKVPGADGKDVPYSAADAREYFEAEGTKFALLNLMAYAQDVGNFHKADKEAIAKN